MNSLNKTDLRWETRSFNTTAARADQIRDVSPYRERNTDESWLPSVCPFGRLSSPTLPWWQGGIRRHCHPLTSSTAFEIWSCCRDRDCFGQVSSHVHLRNRLSDLGFWCGGGCAELGNRRLGPLGVGSCSRPRVIGYHRVSGSSALSSATPISAAQAIKG